MFGKKIHKESGEKYLDCPRCKIHMDKIIKGDVVLDVCNKCNGMWLDDEEIDKLLKLSKRGKRDGKKANKKSKK